jgi:hypothetical protein
LPVLVDQREGQRVEVRDAHRPGLGVEDRVAERRVGTLRALAEGLDPAADPAAVGLQDGDPVAGLLEEDRRDESGDARADDEDVLGRRRPGQAVVDQGSEIGEFEVLVVRAHEQ